jgi:hypothetical protein
MATVVRSGRVPFPSGHAEPAPAYFAVFDGHGGSGCSRAAARSLHRRLGAAFAPGAAIPGLIADAIAGLDAALTARYAEQGCAAAVAIVIGGTVYAANVGDGRGPRGGGRPRAPALRGPPRGRPRRARASSRAAGAFSGAARAASWR